MCIDKTRFSGKARTLQGHRACIVTSEIEQIIEV